MKTSILYFVWKILEFFFLNISVILVVTIADLLWETCVLDH